VNDAPLAAPERHLRIFMGICAAAYAVGGLVFLAGNDRVLDSLNRIGAAAGFPAAPLGDRFWLSLAGSMMLCIATCSYLAWRDVRRHRAMCLPVVVAKAVSTAAGVTFFLASGKVFAYLVVALTDFPLFAATLWLYLRARKAAVPAGP
jgi:uncharacterized membrane protein